MDEINKKNNIKEVIEWLLCILIAVVLALIVRHYVFTPTVVRQDSMKTTLIEGDRLFLDRLSMTLGKELKRGDIITFEAPSELRLTPSQFNQEKPVAIYGNEPKGLFSKFMYHVLEIKKNSYIINKINHFFFILIPPFIDFIIHNCKKKSFKKRLIKT